MRRRRRFFRALRRAQGSAPRSRRRARPALKERTSDGAQFGVSQCYIGIDFGYDVVEWRGLSIFPMLGIGGGDLRIVVDPNAAPFLRGQLGPDDAGNEIRRNVGLFRGLLGIEERVRLWNAQELSLLFGARAGYIQQFAQGG
jgi:hypothetical protein